MSLMKPSHFGLAYDSAGLSDVGRVRAHNEDGFLELPGRGVWVVADGMGGHHAGEVASGTIIGEMATLGFPATIEDQRHRAVARLDQAHRRIRDHALAHKLGVIGSTVAALLIHGVEMTCLWAGDSRIYRLREGALSRLTNDHSEVARLIAMGHLTEEQARHSSRRHIITRAIGVPDAATPDIVTGRVQAGDVFLLCSDGLTEHVEDAEIAVTLASGTDAATIVDGLVGMALARGARDNVTVLAVRCQPEPPGADAGSCSSGLTGVCV